MVAQIKMPALSPTMTEGKLSKWLIQKSSKVVSGDVIAEIETDKATMEIEAVDDGVLYEIFVEEGTDNVAVGSTLALIKEDNDTEDQLNSFLDKNNVNNLSDYQNCFIFLFMISLLGLISSLVLPKKALR